MGDAVRMPFGVHKGTPISSLPDDYLEWLTTIELREPLRGAVLEEQVRRTPSTQHAGLDRALAKKVIDTGFRTLAQQFHPDRGGDLRTMQRLNGTVDWLRKRLEVLA
jgi:uncharacterized protein (DUF3820 family)